MAITKYKYEDKLSASYELVEAREVRVNENGSTYATSITIENKPASVTIPEGANKEDHIMPRDTIVITPPEGNDQHIHMMTIEYEKNTAARVRVTVELGVGENTGHLEFLNLDLKKDEIRYHDIDGNKSVHKNGGSDMSPKLQEIITHITPHVHDHMVRSKGHRDGLLIELRNTEAAYSDQMLQNTLDINDAKQGIRLTQTNIDTDNPAFKKPGSIATLVTEPTNRPDTGTAKDQPAIQQQQHQQRS